MNKTIYRIMSVIMALALTLGVFSSGQAKSKSGALMSGGVVNLAFFYKPPTNSDALTVASNYDTVILTGGDESFRDQLTANGFNSTITQYFGAIGIQNPGSCTAAPRKNQVAYKPGDFCSISADHPDWFLLDTSGQRIPASPGSDTYRMDPGNPGWRNFFVTRVLESQEKNGWSGLFLDNVEASLSDIQKNGITLANYPEDASYHAAVLGFLQYLNANYSLPYHRPLLANIIARRDEASWFSYLQYLDGAMQERWAVGWSPNEYVTESKWKSDMALAEKTESQGKHIILVAPGNQTDSSRQNFAFASYLLLSNGTAAFRYSSEVNYSQVWLYDNYATDLGTPLGPRYQSGSLWRRDFTKGFVVVDPVNHTATISITSPSPTSPTPLIPTATPTTIAPTVTQVKPTAIPVSSPTKTLAPPIATFLPTLTPVQPTATATILPSPTPTPVVPTLTNTSVPATSTLTPISAKTFDEKNPVFVYSTGWQNKYSSEAYGGSYKETTRNGATVTFLFYGRSFSIIYKGNVRFSKFDVYVDGALVGTLNQQMSTTSYQRRWDYPGQLMLGNHTLKLVFKVTSSTINRGSLDAVIVR